MKLDLLLSGLSGRLLLVLGLSGLLWLGLFMVVG
jgi:hypothetical protein